VSRGGKKYGVVKNNNNNNRGIRAARGENSDRWVVVVVGKKFTAPTRGKKILNFIHRDRGL